MAEYSTEEAAQRLGVSIVTVRRQVRRGLLESRKNAVGHLVIILPDSAPSGDYSDGQPAITGAQPARSGDHSGDQTVLTERVTDLVAQLAAAVQRETALLDRLASADTERSELRQLLAREQQAHAEARLMLQNLLPKLPAPGETAPEPPRRSLGGVGGDYGPWRRSWRT